MADTPTPTPESGTPGEAKSSVTTLGPGRPPARRRKRGRVIVLVLLGLALIVVGVLLYHHFAQWESTDDAQIDGYIYPVSSRVTGYVTRVTVDDNQYVKAGTVLVRLDPKDYEVALATANAALANDQASAAALRTNVPLTSVNTSSELSRTGADVESFNAGLIAARRQFEAAQATLQQAEANDLKAQDDVCQQHADHAEDQHRDRVADPVLLALRIDAADPVGEALEGPDDGIEPRLAVRVEDSHKVKPQRFGYQKKGCDVERELKPGVRIVHGAKNSVEGKGAAGSRKACARGGPA